MNAKKGYTLWKPYVGGTFLGIVLFLSFLLTGHGLGASGGLARVLGGAMDAVAPEHMRNSPYLSRYVDGPLSHWIIPMILGVVVGGFLAGLWSGNLKVETYRGPRTNKKTRWVFAVLGGMVAGYGARLARGCTSGQALTGGASLSVGSWAFMLAVFAGGYAMAWFVRKLWN
jgi:uncharacterized membrane protein YedE/YeeE